MQYAETECGIASLAMILAYYQCSISLEDLRDKCGVSRDGCNAKTLINAARSYGLEANAYRVEWDEIVVFSRPVIAYWNFNHYVVLQPKGEMMQVNDPALGVLMINKAEFNKYFTGIIIDIYPVTVSAFPKLKPKADITSKLFLGCSIELLFLLVVLVSLTVILLFNAGLSKVLLDYIVLNQMHSWLFGFVILTVVMGALQGLLIAIQKNAAFSLISKLFIIKSAAIAERILKLPIIFYSLRHRGDIISALSRLEMLLSNRLSSQLTTKVNVIISTLLLMFIININLVLSGIFLLITISYFLALSHIKKILMNAEVANVRSEGRCYTHLLTSINNIETIKSASYEKKAFDKWQDYFISKSTILFENKKLDILFNESKRFYYLLLQLTILLLGMRLVLNGLLSIGTLIAYHTSSIILAQKVFEIFSAYKTYQMSKISAGRLNDIVNYAIDPRFLNTIQQPIDISSGLILSIKSVMFRFNQHAGLILDNIDLNIMQGEQIALVGSTGSGKSTLAKLMCGLYLSNAGSINLLGNDICNYPAKQLAQLITYASQDVVLFSGTVLDNITLFGDYNENLLKFAISVACLDEVINERGLLGKVEEGGSNFSGGERQRIDIARAIYQNTPILILDEATSALDHATQNKVIANLSRLNKTIIYVAHRLSSIHHCRIVLLENGQIIEQGSHGDLIKAKGRYASLINSKHEYLLC